ncbi:MAG TPA: AMP-binding protein [Acidimicrobiales bacterium]|nr:AMP-binding protein [Acidimicrobiales bacterium]
MTRAYASGPAPAPLSGQTIGERLADTVGRLGQRAAVISRHQDLRLTWSELGARVEEAALGLLAIGIAPGDRVGIWSPTCVEWTVLQLATARVGAILVNINPAYRPGEMAYAVGHSGLRVLVTAPRFKTSEYLQMIADTRADLAQLERVVTIGEERSGGPSDLLWSELIEAGRAVGAAQLAEVESGLDPDDPINIQYTSGTTGNPKGATLTHHNILNNAEAVAEVLGYTDADRVCIPVPLYHCFGMGLGNLACVASGATMVYPAESFAPDPTLDAIAEEGCTSIYGVPTMFIAMLESPRFSSLDLSSLRTGIMAGAPCPVEVMKRVVSDMHAAEMTIAYGMTETSPVSVMTRRADDLDRRTSTVGTVLPHVEVKIVEPATGRIAEPGAPGELCSRGYIVMKGYWNDPDATSSAIDEAGWMHTGDLAVMDEYGYVNIVGRLKDMVIRGGENIYPREIEEVLFAHPAVASVQVIGVPDSRMGEELMAWVTFREGHSASDDELRQFCRGHLAHFKVPRYWKVVTEFPMTVTGKIQKFRMREIAVEELGLQDAAAIRTA